MRATPRVSIIIPVYNALPYLPQTVESVLAQTFTDFELLIINDGSSDGFMSWAEQLADRRIRVVHQENLGLGAARNTGLRHATGQFIAFLDADDLWLPTKLVKQVAHLEAHPNVGLTHTSISYVDSQGRKFRKDLKAHGHGNLWRHIIAFNPHYLVHCGSTPLIRKTCFDTLGGFRTDLKFSQDWEMWIRISRHYNFATLIEPLVLYRQHGNNMSKSYILALESFHKIIEDTFQTVEPGLLHLKREAYGRTYLLMAWRAYRAQDYRAARALQQKALGFFPKLRLSKNNFHLSLRLVARRWPFDRGRSLGRNT